ncbi:hypothetical protein HZH68_009023 [Vespula germanica]|uniref:Uncharacterized protein n=2 Tax=Vespula TaxID=7451 RepID=A0A834K5S2_VESGE|nr:hypothetical protein HZH68_009023 [Vespula germanica]KAF7421990.1 hypothetical protein H0235_009826 [Vespula pensylvanica]
MEERVSCNPKEEGNRYSLGSSWAEVAARIFSTQPPPSPTPPPLQPIPLLPSPPLPLPPLSPSLLSPLSPNTNHIHIQYQK